MQTPESLRRLLIRGDKRFAIDSGHSGASPKEESELQAEKTRESPAAPRHNKANKEGA